jgi:hypothetical protein
MFKKSALVILVAAIGFFFAASSAHAGVKMKIGDDSQLHLGMRVQAQYLVTDRDISSSSSGWEDVDDFRVRRARFRLGADVTKWVSAFLQSDSADGVDHKIIDAFVKLKLHPWFNVIMGENMHAGSSRQNLTSSGGLMAIDRPGLANKNLTWGLTNRAEFNGRSLNGPNSSSDGLGAATNAVRDMGVDIFGSGAVGEGVSLKYYLGYADGRQASGTDDDDERIGARVQLNFGDPEPGFYGLSTYLGKKQTISIGAFWDSQDNVGEVGRATDTKGTATTADDTLTNGTGTLYDYESFGFDLFAEQPVGDGAVTFEAGYVDVDLDGMVKKSEGDGFFVQAGYFINNWQPWAMFEQWDSEATDDTGDIDTFRIGLTYFIKGHNANVKVGYESYNSDKDIITGEDSIDTILVGFYMTY